MSWTDDDGLLMVYPPSHWRALGLRLRETSATGRTSSSPPMALAQAVSPSFSPGLPLPSASSLSFPHVVVSSPVLGSLLSSDGSVCVFSASAAGAGPTVRGDARAGGELDHGEDVGAPAGRSSDGHDGHLDTAKHLTTVPIPGIIVARSCMSRCKTCAVMTSGKCGCVSRLLDSGYVYEDGSETLSIGPRASGSHVLSENVIASGDEFSCVDPLQELLDRALRVERRLPE